MKKKGKLYFKFHDIFITKIWIILKNTYGHKCGVLSFLWVCCWCWCCADWYIISLYLTVSLDMFVSDWSVHHGVCRHCLGFLVDSLCVSSEITAHWNIYPPFQILVTRGAQIFCLHFKSSDYDTFCFPSHTYSFKQPYISHEKKLGPDRPVKYSVLTFLRLHLSFPRSRVWIVCLTSWTGSGFDWSTLPQIFLRKFQHIYKLNPNK